MVFNFKTTSAQYRIAQRYTRSIQTLKAKNTYLRTSEVVQACHKILIFF